MTELRTLSIGKRSPSLSNHCQLRERSHLLPEFQRFHLVLINRCMKEQLVNQWLKSHGLRPQNFALIALEQARATLVATELLQQRVGLINAQQTQVLKCFALQTKTKAGRAQITQNQCFKVLNIGKQANRKLFKQNRQLKRQERQAPQR
jgi:hypothetical protein